MDITPYSRKFESALVPFIILCYSRIGRVVEINGKDKDLLNVEQEYCSSGGNLFILHENWKIIGTIAIKFLSTPKGYLGEVHRFYVHPEQQQKGYGNKLLDYIYCYAK